MKKFTLLLSFIFLCTFCIGQKVQKKSYGKLLNTLLKHSVPELTISEAQSLKNAIYLDTRESKEYLVSHIPNAIWIGYDSLRMSTIEKLDKSKTYIVYCSVGYRSEKIAEKLISKGFPKVYNLYGGAFEWINQDHALQNIDGQSTLKIHPYNSIWGMWIDKGQKSYK